MRKFQEQVVQVVRAIPDSGAEATSKLLAMCNDLAKQYDMRFTMNCDHGGQIHVAVDHGSTSAGDWASISVWVLTSNKHMVMIGSHKDGNKERIEVRLGEDQPETGRHFRNMLGERLNQIRPNVPSLDANIGTLNKQRCLADLRMYGAAW